MKPKMMCLLGLGFMIISQILFAQGFEFLENQQPIDFAHWFMLLGAVFLIGFNSVFPKGIINSIAVVLTTIGIVAHIGMCSIDFVLWSFGDNYNGRNELIGQLMNTPVIWYPFMIIGPALLYVGLSTHAWAFIKKAPIPAILTLGGSMAIGAGQFLPISRMVVVVGCIVFAIGLMWLIQVNEAKEDEIKGKVVFV